MVKLVFGLFHLSMNYVTQLMLSRLLNYQCLKLALLMVGRTVLTRQEDGGQNSYITRFGYKAFVTTDTQTRKTYIHTMMGRSSVQRWVTSGSQRESALTFMPLGQEVSRVLIHLFSLIFGYHHDCQVFH